MNIVWLLGAGTSAEAGYPLVSDFIKPSYLDLLDTRCELVGIQTEPIIKEDFLYFFMASEPGKRNLDVNALMSGYLERGDTEHLVRLNTYVLRLLDLTHKAHADFWDAPCHHAFAHYLGASNSSVILFNYDSLVEEQLGFLTYSAMKHLPASAYVSPYSLELRDGSFANAHARASLMDYGSGYLLSQVEPRGRVPVLKLHGSIGWFYCERCHVVLYQPVPDTIVRRLGIIPVGASKYNCPRCRFESTFHALFVPPASDRKFPTWEILDHLWNRAEQLIVSADILLIAGYSLPPDDRRARDLLTRASANNHRLRTVIIDMASERDVLERYKGVFREVIFYHGRFSKFVAELTQYRSDFKSASSRLGESIRDVLVALTSASAHRENGCLLGSIPLDRSLSRVAESADSTSSERAHTLKLLGVIDSGDSLQYLQRLLASTQDTLTRALVLNGIGSGSSQTALDVVTRFIGDITIVDANEPSDLSIGPHRMTSYAQSGVRHFMLGHRELDYRRCVTKLLTILKIADRIPRDILGETIDTLKLAGNSGVGPAWLRSLPTSANSPGGLLQHLLLQHLSS